MLILKEVIGAITESYGATGTSILSGVVSITSDEYKTGMLIAFLMLAGATKYLLNESKKGK